MVSFIYAKNLHILFLSPQLPIPNLYACTLSRWAKFIRSAVSHRWPTFHFLWHHLTKQWGEIGLNRKHTPWLWNWTFQSNTPLKNTLWVGKCSPCQAELITKAHWLVVLTGGFDHYHSMFQVCYWYTNCMLQLPHLHKVTDTMPVLRLGQMLTWKRQNTHISVKQLGHGDTPAVLAVGVLIFLHSLQK